MGNNLGDSHVDQSLDMLISDAHTDKQSYNSLASRRSHYHHTLNRHPFHTVDFSMPAIGCGVDRDYRRLVLQPRSKAQHHTRARG